ncbi:hypothetical protein AX17_005485 [Amanita inopinata Kibby_2008]|nr:hypothetical protein AX17_005485 [Amanita inopinata Kibby_2008]
MNVGIRLGPLLLPILFTAVRGQNVVTVRVGHGDTSYTPSTISAATNDTLRFIFPSTFLSIVQTTFEQPCIPLQGGFNSTLGRHESGSSGPQQTWDLHIAGDDKPLWFHYHDTLQSQRCTEGTVGVINPPSTVMYAEFQNVVKRNTGASPSPAVRSLPSSLCPTTLPSNKSDRRVIVGGAVGGTLGSLFIIVLLLIAFWYHKRRMRKIRDAEFFDYRVGPNGQHPIEAFIAATTVRRNSGRRPPSEVIETAERSLAGYDTRIYQRISSSSIPIASTSNGTASLPTAPLSTAPLSTAPLPTTKSPLSRPYSPPKKSNPKSRHRHSHSHPEPTIAPDPDMVPPDPFANLGRPVSADRALESHQRVRRQGSQRRRQRLSFPEPHVQPTIQEQNAGQLDMELIAREVVALILSNSRLQIPPQTDFSSALLLQPLSVSGHGLALSGAARQDVSGSTSQDHGSTGTRNSPAPPPESQQKNSTTRHT